jgi:hypothetical protein
MGRMGMRWGLAFFLLAACEEEGGLIERVAEVEVEPRRLDFGEVPLGATRRLSVQVRSAGNMPLEIRSVETEAPFSVELPTEPVPAGVTLPLEVAFTPEQGDAPLRGQLVLGTNAANAATVEVALEGQGAPSFLEVSPLDVDFRGTERFETRSAEIVLRQRGAATVEGQVVAEGFRFPEHYDLSLLEDLSDRAPFAVAPDGQVVATLRYQPVVRGEDRGIVRFETCGDRCGYEVRVRADAGAAALEFDPPFLDFGEVGIGDEVSGQVLLRNVGTESIAVQDVRLEASGDFDLNLERAVPFALGPGDVVQAVVRFAPSDASSQQGLVRVRTDLDRLADRTVPIDGRGIGPRFEVSPPTINFGVETRDGPSRRQILLANAGSSRVQVTDLTITGDPAFRLGDLPGLPARLGPGETALVPVEFFSAQLGTHSATVAIVTDDQARMRVDVPVRAFRGERFCELRVDPPEINFGLLEPGLSRVQQAILTNRGTAGCEMQVSLRTPADPFFSLEGEPPGSLSRGQSAQVRLRFSPTERRPAKSTLFIETNDPAAPVKQVPILGTGEGYGDLEVVPDSVDFGTLRVDCKRERAGIQLVNAGSIPVQVKGARLVSVEGADAPDLRVTDGNGFGLAPGGVGGFSVEFAPRRLREQRADLWIEFDELPYPIRVPVRGDAAVDAQVTDTFRQRQTGKADVLFVIDDSCSMLDNQEALANNIESFIEQVDPDETHYRVGITTVSVSRRDGDLVGPVLDSESRSRNRLIQQFRQQARVGVMGSGFELGLEAALRAMERADLGSGFNRDLLREDASFTLIVVSDEDDQSPGTGPFYASRMEQLAGGPITTAVVSGGPTGCDTALPTPRYEAFLQATGGQGLSICGDWGANLQVLGELTFGLQRRFELSQVPQPGNPIRVEVDGVTAGSTVRLQPPRYLVFDPPPPRGSRIRATYSPECDL